MTVYTKILTPSQFITVAYGVVPLQLRFSADLGMVLTAADAGFLTEVEYQCVLSRLRMETVSLEAEIVMLAFILGYRCGCRISECVHIQLDDLLYAGMIESDVDLSCLEVLPPMSLLLRNNAYNRLKTTDSRRCLPLYLFLSQEEQRLLMEFHRKQAFKVDFKLPNRFLFSTTSELDHPVDVELLYERLHPVMREVTGNPDSRYHYLRHSFANHLLAAMSCRVPITPLPRHWMVSDGDTGTVMQTLFPTQGHPTRLALFQIAEWLGHVSPETTLARYIHICDWLLKEELSALSFNDVRNGLAWEKRFVRDFDLEAALSGLLGVPSGTYRVNKFRAGSAMA